MNNQLSQLNMLSSGRPPHNRSKHMFTTIKHASVSAIGMAWLGAILLGATFNYEEHQTRYRTDMFRDHPLVGEFY